MQTYATDYRDSDYTNEWNGVCGLTQEEYNILKNTMLKSIYDNGGFWISQYEIGTETLRKSASDTQTTPLSKECVYAYTYVDLQQALKLTKQMNSGNYNSSLLFGTQWDLTLKFIEKKGNKTQEQIKKDSTQWGNCQNATFDVEKGKYSIGFENTFTDILETYTKPSGTRVLLTTEATKRNSVLNIYDLAGNVFEWTLEKSSIYQATSRGGSYTSNGETFPAYAYNMSGGSNSDSGLGFRSSIY